MVSNSEAVCAKSSSSSGSSCSLTAVTLDVDLDVLAHQVATDELGGEGLLVAGGHPDERLVEALEGAAAADLVAHPGHVSALDDLAVLAGGEVEGDEVAVRGGSLDLGQGREALAEVLHLGLDVLVGDLEVVDGDGQPGVVRQVHLGTDVDLGGELEGLVVLELGDVDLRLGERLELVGLEGVDVELGEGGVDRLVEDRATADLTVDDGRGAPCPCGSPAR